MLSSARSRITVAAVSAVVIGGGTYGIVAATSSGPAAASSSGPAAASSSGGHYPFGGSGSGARGSNARSGPAAGGAIGTVSGITSSGFTLSTSGSQKETIKETSSTTYDKGSSPATATAVAAGAQVMVLGTTDSTTITAAQVIVSPPSSSTSPGGQVIPYTKGKQGSSQQVGTIPSDYSQGDGTIVSGETAYKATEAALAAYPGGVVDRVVALGGGDYEVHNIGVNWPHHIFVDQDFRVIGANS